jgi:hypothetical protein
MTSLRERRKNRKRGRKEKKKDRRNYERKTQSLKIIVDNCNEDRPRWWINEIAPTRRKRVTR